MNAEWPSVAILAHVWTQQEAMYATALPVLLATTARSVMTTFSVKFWLYFRWNLYLKSKQICNHKFVAWAYCPYTRSKRRLTHFCRSCFVSRLLFYFNYVEVPSTTVPLPATNTASPPTRPGTVPPATGNAPSQTTPTTGSESATTGGGGLDPTNSPDVDPAARGADGASGQRTAQV